MKPPLMLVLALLVPHLVSPVVAKPASKATKTAKKAPVLQWPRISRENQDQHWENIRDLQLLLNARGAKLKVDGDFGAQTEAAVKKFQITHRLKADGVVGPQTWEKLVVRLRRGDKGPAVRALQAAMYGHNGEWVEELRKETGVFGFETERAVRYYQKYTGIKVDGVAGPQTWCVLFDGKVIKQ